MTSVSESEEIQPIIRVEAADAPKEKLFFPNLDGLRFFCFLSVFLFHSFATDYIDVRQHPLYNFTKHGLARNGSLGVNFFFVLSGFLITYLLITEKKHFGQINVRAFYLRRILRIWPLFYLCVFFGFVIFPVIKQVFGQIPHETAHWPFYVTFLNNFDFIHNLQTGLGLPDASSLGVLWSVAIEEQFYLVWPILFFLLPQRFYLTALITIISGSFIFRLLHTGSSDIMEFHTISCISDMTVGGIAAVLALNFPKFKDKIIDLPKSLIWGLYFCVAIVFFFHKELFWWSDLSYAADRLVISVLFAMVILEQNFSRNSLFKMSSFPKISKLGTITYGLYCLHMIGILIAFLLLKKAHLNKNVYEVIFLEGSLSLLITIIIAKVSYTWYESRFLRLKERFSKITRN